MLKALYKIPANFEDKEFLYKVRDLNNKYEDSGKVIETYGSLPSGFLGNAFPSKELPNIDLRSIETYIKKSKECEIGFNYTMNSIWHNGIEFEKDRKVDIYAEVKKLVDLGIERFTVATPFLVSFFEYNFPKIKVDLSINLDASSIRRISRWKKHDNVSRIVIPRYQNRNFKLLKQIINNNKVECELIVNSMCNLQCNLHNYHNMVNCSASIINNKINYTKNTLTLQCLRNHLINHNELICTGWIRPEDIEHYLNVGISNFKIEGRMASSSRILFMIETYLKKSYDGNFFDIVGFPNNSNKGLMYFLDNKSLNGFLDYFVNNNIECSNCTGDNEYCKNYAEKIEVNNRRAEEITIKMLDNYIEKYYKIDFQDNISQ